MIELLRRNLYWWNLHVHLQFSHRISEWAYGVQNDFLKAPEQLTYDEKHHALKSIAFINVKKTSGGSSANSAVIFKYIQESKDLLHRQIQEISPTHIITCFRYDHYPNELFDMVLKRTDSNTFGYGFWNGIKVINTELRQTPSYNSPNWMILPLSVFLGYTRLTEFSKRVIKGSGKRKML